MILRVAFLLAMSFASVEGVNAHITCQRSFSKIGCFKESNIRPDLALRPMTLEITDRDTSSPKYQGYLIDWSNMEASAHSLACRCASAARSMKMNYFSLRFWGECWVGKTDIAKLIVTLQDPTWLSTDCVNSWSYAGVCDHKHEKECVAKAGSGYIYFLDDASKSEEKIDGGYSEWSSFTECSTTCGLGTMKRERTCTKPAPLGKGKDCSGFGPMDEEKPCNLRQCPVDGGISEWTNFGACSKSCGGGISLRTRSCTNPSPSNGGKGCSESVSETKNCASDPCPVNGGISEWTNFGACSKSCGGGISLRTRSCTNPSPSNGGKGCSESVQETKNCAFDPCPEILVCKRSYTPYNSDGSGNVFYLDRHNLQCDAGFALNSFKLERDSSTLKTYRYALTCCSPKNKFFNRVQTNPFTDVVAGNAVYLDRQDVSCNDNFISSFLLLRSGNQVRYTYTCGVSIESKMCYEDSTNFNSDGNGNAIYLDRQNVACKDNYFLTRFRLVRNPAHTLYKYVFNCCK